MTIQLQLIRAISGEFIARKFMSIVLLFAVVGILVLGGAIWLTTISARWWLLAIPVIGFVLLGIVTCVAARVIIGFVRPKLTKLQSTNVARFVDKLERIAENLQTPMFIVVYRVIRDVIRPHDPSFVQTMIGDSTSLRKDLADLQRDFAS
ncbi:MAG: hypothetical protein ABWX94_02845 [Candidatus Saccharimonadales bacterium]